MIWFSKRGFDFDLVLEKRFWFGFEKERVLILILILIWFSKRGFDFDLVFEKRF